MAAVLFYVEYIPTVMPIRSGTAEPHRRHQARLPKTVVFCARLQSLAATDFVLKNHLSVVGKPADHWHSLGN